MAIFLGEPGLASFTGAKGNGSDGDNWSYKTCKAPVKSSPPTNLNAEHWIHWRNNQLPAIVSEYDDLLRHEVAYHDIKQQKNYIIKGATSVTNVANGLHTSP